MPTGLLIRDFHKFYREVRYESQGSLRLTETEHSAYLNRLTLEVTHYDAPRSINFKTLPENTHWGYLTTFKGSSVIASQPVKFSKQRVYEAINQGLWQYHQHTESLKLQDGLLSGYANQIVSFLIDDPAIAHFIVTSLELADDYLDAVLEAPLHWILSQFIYSAPPSAPANEFTAFPVVSPFPDVFKFKSDIPLSFLMRLESWYLVNPAVYILSNPTDTSDATEGEDEYPQPIAGDGDGEGQEFPPNSAVPPGSDGRDFGDGPGAQLDSATVYVWNIVVKGIELGGNGQPLSFTHNLQVQSVANGLPFSASANSSERIFHNGESWKGGYSVYDRFGQVVVNMFPNGGFREGSISLTSTVLAQ